MADIIWNKFTQKKQQEYIDFLKVFGALSGLFKDIQEGTNARKPYLYYRNHEQLYARVFTVEDLTRKDSAFDAVAHFDDEKVGIGLKTWIHSKDFTYQKVAEFNKLAPIKIDPLIEADKPEEVIKMVAQLRNERINLDKRLYKTDREIYHFVTRDTDVMKIFETSYDFIDLDTIELIDHDKKSFVFKDKLHKYKFYRSKSVLMEEFDASDKDKIIEIPIELFEDPFELIKMIRLPHMRSIAMNEQDAEPKVAEDKAVEYFTNNEGGQVIYLPLYSDKADGMHVPESSGVNARHGKSKNKGSNTLRPEFEVEVRISKWIHTVFPGFFGINALNKDEINNEKINDFDLILPDGRVLRGRVKQEAGKSLQTNPQNALGEWIIKDVLGLTSREDRVTDDLLVALAIDSLKITKIDNKHFKITVAEEGAYERFKLENEQAMKDRGLSGKSLPRFRREYEVNIDDEPIDVMV